MVWSHWNASGGENELTGQGKGNANDEQDWAGILTVTPEFQTGTFPRRIGTSDAPSLPALLCSRSMCKDLRFPDPKAELGEKPQRRAYSEVLQSPNKCQKLLAKLAFLYHRHLSSTSP